MAEGRSLLNINLVTCRRHFSGRAHNTVDSNFLSGKDRSGEGRRTLLCFVHVLQHLNFYCVQVYILLHHNRHEHWSRNALFRLTNAARDSGRQEWCKRKALWPTSGCRGDTLEPHSLLWPQYTLIQGLWHIWFGLRQTWCGTSVWTLVSCDALGKFT